ncbi:MAG: hypothetical protein E6I59_14105 [Chloroflexi bacterium]|nr:MAG: hypothetical protein E6I59_14105 [Chloroflexota bacterium]
MIGLAIAFFVGPFLPILFITLAFTSLIGSASSLRPNGLYGGLQGFVWLMGLALCFVVGFWPWILVVCGVSIILGALRAPIMATIMGMGIFGLASLSNQQPPQTYQPYQPPQPTYQQGYPGYTPPQTQETYQEGGQQHPYPSQTPPQQYQQPPQPQPQYEQPQVQYPQEMPPQQMPPQQTQQ